MAAKRKSIGRILIGTSGWHYASWWGPFFPASIRKKDALAYYASRFRTAELNAPFYRTPTEIAVESWRAGTPEDFVFAWKASKFITHWKRLSARSENSLQLLDDRAKILGGKLGPILFQLPPKMQADRERLASFFKMLPKSHRYVFEFRHESWYQPAILGVLRDHDAALCISDHADAQAPWDGTASFAYIRGHGPSGRYHGSYSDETLREWSQIMREWAGQGRDVFCYFDNDQKSAAPADAERLVALVNG